MISNENKDSINTLNKLIPVQSAKRSISNTNIESRKRIKSESIVNGTKNQKPMTNWCTHDIPSNDEDSMEDEVLPKKSVEWKDEW